MFTICKYFFGQGCECRFNFPVSAAYVINISIDKEAEEVLWYSIDGNDNKVKP
jgi:hypothetical protein